MAFILSRAIYEGLQVIRGLIVGWQATQKLYFDNTIRKMIFDGGICLFGCLLRIYDERFHLPNRVIKFP